MKRLLLCGMILIQGISASWGGEIEFVENFALSPDREAALKQLIPGTEDYYYWNSLHLLNTEQFDKVEELIAPWVQRFGETQRVWEIRTRRALLTYDRNPQASLDYLRGRFGINYPHRKEELNAEPNLPVTLDPNVVSRANFRQQALARHGNSLNGFEDTALDWLVTGELNPDQRRQLLSRLTRPDYDSLVKLVIDDLNHKDSGGFGSHGIHRLLLKSQLDDALLAKPDLLNQQNFVRIYLTRLQPGPDVAWRLDPAEMQKYLERLQVFADRLDPVHNSLKAHVLYHRLLLERSQGRYSKDLLLAYLKLPRPVGYNSRAMQESEAIKRFACDLNSNYDGTTLLPPIGNDEPLVRSYLAQFFVEAGNTKEFEPYIDDIYLRHLFAETKIVNGLGEPEQWASLLPPELFRQLKDRVDLDFDPSNKTQFTAEAPVSLDLHVKNVSTLIVKVFEINAKNFYRQNGKEIDTDINLDGLVANVEQSYQYNDAPLRRIARRFEFPMLNKPGVYIVDFIGNGQSSRALIRKGHLKHLVRTTGAGQVFTILDEHGKQVRDASIWLAGHEYTAGEDGQISVPFSSSPGQQPIVITAGVMAERDEHNGATYSSLAFFNHEPESYQFAAGFYVDREALLTRKTADLLIRPGLTVNGTPVSLKMLEDVKLTISSIDLDGVASAVDVVDFQLFEDRESVHEFQVPQRLASLTFRLTAKIQQVITGTKMDVSAEQNFTLNGIDRTEKVEDLHLLRAEGNYVLELRGRTGEPRISRPVSFSFKHRDFKDSIGVVLKTDPGGRIVLGTMDDIAAITANGPEGTSHTWTLLGDRHTYSQTVHARVGDLITLPHLGKGQEPSRNELSLLELAGNAYGVDRFEHLAINDGLLVINGLPAGDYDLLLKSTMTQITLRVSDGEQLGHFVVGKQRQLETKLLESLQIESITADEEKIRIQLRNVSKFARVHIFATRYVPEYDAFGHLSRVRDVEPYLYQYSPAQSVYLTGRNIGDEYRYIIDRRYANKYPGNMLERPSLLLNPWAVRETETGEQLAEAGGEFAGRGGMAKGEALRKQAGQVESPPAEENFADLDFLASASAVLVNLIPDESGVVEVNRDAFGAQQDLHVVAADPLSTTYRSLTLPEPLPKFVDLRLIASLDPALHFTRQKQISVVPPGQAFTLGDITTAKFEAYDSLSRVYGLYATLNPDPNLADFAFVLNWPKLKPEEKRTLYSKYASHELSFFIARKDPEFFEAVIKPYLVNKKDKTFIDHYLSEDDLSGFLQPWKFGQLNIVERILLARRIDGEGPKTARHVSDLLALQPPDVDRFIHLFDTASQRSALETGDAMGLKDALVRFNRIEVMDVEVSGDLPALAFSAVEAPAPQAAARAMSEIQNGAKEEQKLFDKAKSDAKKRDGSSDLSRRSRAESENASAASDELAAGESAESLFRDLSEKRQSVRALYRKLNKTKEWAENNYHHLTIAQQNADLITVNAFWRDFAAHDPQTPFLSRNLAEASQNFPEILMALSVLDLPFEAMKHETKFEGTQMTLTPGGAIVVFHEEIEPAEAPDGIARVLVSQNFFRHGDRQRIENGETVDKFVTEEFLIHTAYGCQVVITNPTSSRQKLNVLVQIPRGAIPVLNSQATKTLHVDLEPYHTQTVEYHFYFPAAGEFPHFPVHVARNEKLIAAAEPVTLTVVDRLTKFDRESWDYVSQYGTLDDVLTFLNTHNINALNLDRVAWRMHDKAALDAILPLLASRHVYQHTLWSYALLHNETAAANEFLQHAENIVNETGGRLKSTLLTIDPVLRRTMEHLEYKPLVNARAHSLGQRREIVNERLLWQYHRFLKELAYERTLQDEEQLTVTYYLFLQDRIDEALAAFAKVSRDNVTEKMQYDYCAACAKFFSDEPEAARQIAVQYAEHPVDRWRNTFAAIASQLDEATGNNVAVVDPENRNQQQGQLAATEPSLDFTVEAKKISLNYRNLETVQINFYEMDVELLFSRNPFVQQVGGNFASIKPNKSLTVPLKNDEAALVLDLPDDLRNRNVLVEVVGGGQTKTQPYFSNSLSVQVIENYGQVAVTNSQSKKPVAKAYVKVYAEMTSGEVKFYKDGYTDLRGRFDYASLNTNDLDVANKFSILVLSDDFGAIVREALPPKQ